MAMRVAAGILAVLASVALVAPASADDTGLATALHTVGKEGKRLCMTDHWHYGSGSTKPDKKSAISDAVSAWEGFTALEYGTDWARFAKAGSKKVSCSQSSGGLSCSVEARPCK